MSDYLPQHLWHEIIKRLPVKSVARSRCVCREWNALVCSSSFIADHLACSKTKPRLFLNNIYQIQTEIWKSALIDSEMHDEHAVTLTRPITTNQTRQITDPFSEVYGYDLVGSANGIICLRGSGAFPEIVLWNPIINKYIKLPKKSTCFASLRVQAPIAMGVKPPEDDLRVLSVTWELRDFETNVGHVAEIYSVRHGVWRVLQVDIPSCNSFGNFQVQAYINGATHWVATNEDRLFVLCFDFEEEVFSSITLPDILADYSGLSRDAAVYCGRLAVMVNVEANLKIWVMSEYGSVDSWSVIFCLPHFGWNDHNHGFTNDGMIIISRFDFDLLLYDPITRRTVSRLGVYAIDEKSYACQLVESLVFMDGVGGAASLYQ